MSHHPLQHWSQFLSDDDYTSLISYVENVRNFQNNNSILLLVGEGPTGKSTLMREIKDYIETTHGDLCSYQNINMINFHDNFSSLTIFIEGGFEGRYNNINIPREFITKYIKIDCGYLFC